MRTAIALALLLAACRSAPQTQPARAEDNAAYVRALREEYRALGRIQAVLRWYVSTQGETSLNQLTYIGRSRRSKLRGMPAAWPRTRRWRCSSCGGR
jgi:hypothetical protein